MVLRDINPIDFLAYFHELEAVKLTNHYKVIGSDALSLFSQSQTKERLELSL